MDKILGNTTATTTMAEQTYNPESNKPQSGKAVATALANKVDKVSGKGLSTNDFTNALKTRLENNTFDGFITAEYNEETDEYEFDFDNLNIEGIYLLYKPERSDDVAYTYYILTVNAAHDGTDTVQFLLNLKNGEMESRQDFGRWQKISVSQTDLKDATKGFATTTDIDNAIGDVETSLENIIQKYGLGGDGV